MTEPDRNVTPSTTVSSRLAAIRARLDEGEAVRGSDARWLLDELQAARASAERYRRQLVNIGRFDA